MGLDWIAVSFGLAGAYLVGAHNKYGWISYMVGSVLTGYLAYKVGYYGIMTGCICYLVLELRGFINHDSA